MAGWADSWMFNCCTSPITYTMDTLATILEPGLYISLIVTNFKCRSEAGRKNYAIPVPYRIVQAKKNNAQLNFVLYEGYVMSVLFTVFWYTSFTSTSVEAPARKKKHWEKQKSYCYSFRSAKVVVFFLSFYLIGKFSVASRIIFMRLRLREGKMLQDWLRNWLLRYLLSYISPDTGIAHKKKSKHFDEALARKITPLHASPKHWLYSTL
jgi:hypothetical protein